MTGDFLDTGVFQRPTRVMVLVGHRPSSTGALLDSIASLRGSSEIIVDLRDTSGVREVLSTATYRRIDLFDGVPISITGRYEIHAPAPPSYCPSLDDSQPYLGAPRDLSRFARLSQGLVPPPRVYEGPTARWRPLPVRLVPRVVRRQSRLQ